MSSWDVITNHMIERRENSEMGMTDGIRMGQDGRYVYEPSQPVDQPTMPEAGVESGVSYRLDKATNQIVPVPSMDANAPAAPEENTVMDAIGEGISDVLKGVGSGVVTGLSKAGQEIGDTFTGGFYSSTVMPWLRENVPGLSSANEALAEATQPEGTTQEVSAMIAEPLSQIVAPGALVTRGLQAAGIGSRLLREFLGYGTAEVAAVAPKDQTLLEMGIELIDESSEVRAMLDASLGAQEDENAFMERLKNAPRRFFEGGPLGLVAERAIEGIGMVYRAIRNSPKYQESVQRLNEGKSPMPVGMSIEDVSTKAIEEGDKNAMQFAAKIDPAPVFYSAVSNAVDNLPMEKGNAQQMRAMIAKSQGVKAEEMAWIGLDDFLKGKKSVTKQEIKEYVDENQLQIDEVTKESMGDVEYQNIIWDESQIDDSYDAYSHRSEDIAYELDRGDDSFIESIISQLQKQSPKKYPETETKWADKIRDHFENGGTVGDLDDNTRWEVNNAIDGVAKEEYLDNPYINMNSRDGYEIYGNDDVGYQITYGGYNVNDSEVYSLDEAKIQAQVHALDNGNVEFDRPEDATRFDEYVEDGGENYREVLLTLPKQPVSKVHYAIAAAGINRNTVDPNFIRGHFDEPNVLAHFRLNDRTGPNGERILFIEEIQSDWHQQGRNKGYRTPEYIDDLSKQLKQTLEKLSFYHEKVKKSGNDLVGLELDEANSLRNKADQLSLVLVNNKNLVPDAPLKKTWHEMSFRRIARMAAEEGYDSISWTSGQMQVERYPGTPEAKKQGLIKRYDEMITGYAKKWGKKFKSKVGTSEVNDKKVWTMPVTKEMRDSVLSKGVATFGAAGVAVGMNSEAENGN